MRVDGRQRVCGCVLRRHHLQYTTDLHIVCRDHLSHLAARPTPRLGALQRGGDAVHPKKGCACGFVPPHQLGRAPQSNQLRAACNCGSLSVAEHLKGVLGRLHAQY